MPEVVCNKCLGLGFLPWFKNIDDGVCFKCKGTGYVILAKKPYKTYDGPDVPLAAFFESLGAP